MSDDKLLEHLSFWRNTLENTSFRLDLPSQADSSLIKQKRGAVVEATINESSRSRLMTLCRSHNTTWFVLMLATLSVLLSRLTGQQDIVIGSPVAGRSHPATHDLLGLFLNTLVLRVQTHEEMSFDELLVLAKRAVFDAYKHQELPFEKLVEELVVERDLERNPLFDVFLNVTSKDWVTLNLPGLKTEFLRAKHIVANFALSLYVMDLRKALELRLIYQEGILTEMEAVSATSRTGRRPSRQAPF
jgi:non-ribosomal peptide synthetase component F